ncbi:MAG TPA: glycerophosphodiester phosphodiesterase [Alcanivoracaceae bacterium]|nr:glycerophosphodiester phosphodiesterase [Alcanivoracaceae bacterium]
MGNAMHIPHIIGHRGARGESPENTLASFLYAAETGVQGIELDVRMSKDKVLVVFHDKDLRRTTHKKGYVHSTHSKKLLRLDASKDGPYWPTATPIPTLKEVIQKLPAHLHYQLEVKGFMSRNYLFTLAERLARLIDELDIATRVVVTCEDVAFLRILHEQHPTIKRGYVCQYRYRRPIGNALKYQCEWLIANYRLMNARTMRLARENGLKVSCWTVNNMDEARRLAALGVDSIITDYPSSLLSYFQRLQARTLAVESGK